MGLLTVHFGGLNGTILIKHRQCIHKAPCSFCSSREIFVYSLLSVCMMTSTSVIHLTSSSMLFRWSVNSCALAFPLRWVRGGCVADSNPPLSKASMYKTISNTWNPIKIMFSCHMRSGWIMLTHCTSCIFNKCLS